MNTEEIKEYLARNPDDCAYGLLFDADPKLISRFYRVCTTLKKLMDDVQKHFPEATYYTASGGLYIVLGDTHSGQNCDANQELSAVGASNGLTIGDGDW